MSLINEALKKAQRLRHEETGDPSAPSPTSSLPVAETPAVPASSHPAVRRGKTTGANTLVLVGSGAIVLVVLSVVVTVVLLNRSSTPASNGTTSVATARPAPVEPTALVATTSVEPPPLTPPMIAALPKIPSGPLPETTPAAPSAVPAPAPAAAVAVAPASDSDRSTPETALPPPAAAPTPVPAAAPPAPPMPDERIATFVEAIKVTGIRSSGADSRVLMNDRVFRVNDTVERLLGVKLSKVGTDQLTFVDANGIEYLKSF